MSWLYEYPGSAYVTRSRLRCAATSVFDAPNGDRWRGGVVWAVVGSAVTLRVQAEQSYVRDLTVSIDLFTGTGAAAVVGAPIAARVTGPHVDALTVHEVRGALPGHGLSDEAGLVAQGTFVPAILNGCVPGCHTYQDEG